MRRIVLLLMLAAAAFGAGLLVFIAQLPPPASGSPTPADGVVVFTGQGDRLAPAMALLDQGAGRRLLISGVNPEVKRPELAGLWPGDPALFDCCVDLGLEAQSTEGNAMELGDWAKRNGFRSLILVTAEYHMPRALLEARKALPGVAIAAYPVASGQIAASGWPADRQAWRRLVSEYVKYLAVRAKTAVDR